MEDKRESGRPDKIQELILKEKEAAERNFETTRFEAGLFERIRNAEAIKPATGPVFIRRPGPVLALAALLLIIAGFLFFRRPSPPPFEQTVRAMSAVLGTTGYGRQIEDKDSTAQRISVAEYTEFGWALKGVLYACERESLGDVGLAEALYRVLLRGTPRAAPSAAREQSYSPGEEGIRLRTDRDFQTFFTGFLKKFEEV